MISTHAPRAGSDCACAVWRRMIKIFQPTLPVRGATSMLKYERTDAVFQPTLPVRGATRCVLLPVLIVFNFNPRSPCGERLHSIPNGFVVSNFNPRSPCGERPSRGLFHFRYSEFQPTLPVRGATAIVANPLLPDIISTHAPRAGSDDFIHCIYLPYPISTHAPRAGSDKKALFGVHADRDFNPRSPCGERPCTCCMRRCRRTFQPTLPVRGATKGEAKLVDGA